VGIEVGLGWGVGLVVSVGFFVAVLVRVGVMEGLSEDVAVKVWLAALETVAENAVEAIAEVALGLLGSLPMMAGSLAVVAVGVGCARSPTERRWKSQ
jgi:hypothetical protein